MVGAYVEKLENSVEELSDFFVVDVSGKLWVSADDSFMQRFGEGPWGEGSGRERLGDYFTGLAN